MVTKCVDLTGLEIYDNLIKNMISDGDILSFKSALFDETTRVLKLFKIESPTVDTVADFSVEIPETNTSNLYVKITLEEYKKRLALYNEDNSYIDPDSGLSFKKTIYFITNEEVVYIDASNIDYVNDFYVGAKNVKEVLDIIATKFDSKADNISYDKEKSEFQLKAGDTILSTITIEILKSAEDIEYTDSYMLGVNNLQNALDKNIENLNTEIERATKKENELENELNSHIENDTLHITSIEKTKLSGIAEGANKTTVDATLSDTSTNPVQNKVIKAEIDTLKKFVSDGKTAVAVAITGKGVTTATDASFETMAENISVIETGIDTSIATATPEQILTGKTAGVGGEIITGTMPNNGAVSQALNAGGSYTIPKGYHNGSGKVTANSLASQTDGTAVASEILTGKTAFVDGVKVTGSMPDLTASSTVTHSTSNGTKVVLGDAAFMETNSDGTQRAEIRYNGNAGRISGNTLLAVPVATMRTAVNTGTNATAAQILTGYKAYSGSTLVSGSMTNQGAKTASLNCGGSYTIPAGYHNGSGKVTANSLASQTSANAVAADIASGKTAWVNGVKVTGTAVIVPP